MRRSTREIAIGAVFFFILALLIVPVPPVFLDLLLSVSLTFGLVTLLLALYAERPLEFSVFPSLLLMLTLLRLGLNVASTRLILLNGGDGAAAAGHVIESFGSFTVGGNYVVGLVIFLIFVIINFMVITKGAGRIAEVAARFTLDAMPGKQMAIDADLNQGVIDDHEAVRRRTDIQREADFYGAMDGASKFVKGDAMAGIVIMLINVVGGLVIGVVQLDMGIWDALETYTILTVGDGLVSQVPALVISTAAGVIVSRAAAGEPLADEITRQVLLQPRAMGVASAMLAAMALTPGLPFLPFAVLSVGAGLLSRTLAGQLPEPEAEDAAALAATLDPEAQAAAQEAEVKGALSLDELELEIGYGLIQLVDPERGGELLTRIRGIRKQLATELGFLVPLVHIRDNLQLEPNTYSILVRGNPVAKGEVPPGRWLALRGDAEAAKVPGIKTRDPAFGLPAVWVQERDRERASAAGYAVVDASTSVATHLAEVIRSHSPDLLSRQQVRELLDQLAETSPKVVEEIVPSIVPVAVLHRTLRALLAERVSIRDLSAILETLAEYAPRIHDPDLLTDLVRERLGRTITRRYQMVDGSLRVITLAPDVEEALRQGVQRSDSGAYLSIDPQTLDRLVKGIEETVKQVGGVSDGRGPVLLSSQSVRSPLRQILGRVVPRLAVVSHNELPADVQIVGDGIVRLADAH
jgi:flagellar biosynthesis protein FlhA